LTHQVKLTSSLSKTSLRKSLRPVAVHHPQAYTQAPVPGVPGAADPTGRRSGSPPAARLLGLSEKTVRAWAAAGVLTVAPRSPRLLLDVRSVHAVSHLVSELRAAGQDRDLLDQVWRRLEDAALLDRDDLRESLDQMCRGEGRVLRPIHSGSPPESR
jgi:hypothetical protein